MIFNTFNVVCKEKIIRIVTMNLIISFWEIHVEQFGQDSEDIYTKKNKLSERHK